MDFFMKIRIAKLTIIRTFTLNTLKRINSGISNSSFFLFLLATAAAKDKTHYNYYKTKNIQK